MSRQMITRQRAPISPKRSFMFDGPNLSERPRVFLVLISHDSQPTVFHENNPLQRMKTIRMEPGESPWVEPSLPVTGPPPEMMLAVRPLPGTLDGPPLSSRLVQGEIMRDQLGRFYEKIGLQLRPLHCIVAGPNGEILELAPPRALPHVPDSDADEVPQDLTQTGESTYRKLLPDPGEWRAVSLGDFKDLLAGQLSHPERLRDSHRMTCYVQVYEITKAQRIEALATEVFGKAETDLKLLPFTPAMAGKLQLLPLLQRRPHIPVQMRRERGLLLPNDRLFSLELINDPTADREAQDKAQTDSPTPADSGQGLALASVPRKNAIPERFLKPWEFQLSREEALYDVQRDGRFNRMVQRAKLWLQGHRQFQKWHALLSGKNFEEQLWSVRPPQGAIGNPSILEWARKTLEIAGYDSATMLIEWQVYWRRKGLS